MAKDRLSGKLVVILHADVAGSTQLVQQDEQLAHERIQDAFRRFSDTIGKYHGRVQELRGDALLAEFERASDAVTAALSFQSGQSDHLEKFNDDIQPKIRVGIALGEVVIADGTVTGAGVVLAQRVEQLAEPGGLCITPAIHEALPNRMPFSFESLGEQTLKGFEDHVRVYRVQLSTGELVPPPQQISHHQVSAINWWQRIVTIVVVVLVAVGIGYWSKYTLPKEEPASIERMASPLPDKPSIAVLPFTNMSGDVEQEYFVDGMTDDLITDLSKNSGLFVIARNSAFTYKGKAVNVHQVAEELGVRYVLGGSIRRAGNQVRINAQLTDATTGGQIWADRYDGMIENVFDLQDDITARILSVLQVQLINMERESASQRYTKHLDAYDSLLRGQAAAGHRSKEENLVARGYFEQAIAIDPGFARAYSELANAYRIEYRSGWSAEPERSLATAYDLVKKAIKLDESLSQAHFVLAQIYRARKEHKKAIVSIERAIELDPNSANAIVSLASNLCYGGRGAIGLDLIERAKKLNPHYPSNYSLRTGQCYFVGANYAEAIEAFGQGVELAPDSQRIHAWLAASYVLAGNQEESEWEADIIRVLNPDFSVEELRIGEPFKDPKHLETFLDALRKAGLPG
jgi:TolB-like protein/Flp pilus assembly protein TadD